MWGPASFVQFDRIEDRIDAFTVVLKVRNDFYRRGKIAVLNDFYSLNDFPTFSISDPSFRQPKKSERQVALTSNIDHNFHDFHSFIGSKIRKRTLHSSTVI